MMSWNSIEQMSWNCPDEAEWYERNGRAAHGVAEDKGQWRWTTVRDARRHGLVPGVRNVVSVLARPRGSACVAELVAERARWFRRGAELVAVGLEVDPGNPAVAWLRFYREWLQERCRRVEWTERVAVHEGLGFAGSLSLMVEHREHGRTLVDVRMQGERQAMSSGVYRSWGYEVAAKREALGQMVPCVTLIMNGLEPHPVVEAPWSEAHLAECWRGFRAARELWVMEKGYEPGGRQSAECRVQKAA